MALCASSGLEVVAFLLVAYCHKQLRHRVPEDNVQTDLKEVPRALI
jgi:hypothetical protein